MYEDVLLEDRGDDVFPDAFEESGEDEDVVGEGQAHQDPVEDRVQVLGEQQGHGHAVAYKRRIGFVFLGLGHEFRRWCESFTS